MIFKNKLEITVSEQATSQSQAELYLPVQCDELGCTSAVQLQVLYFTIYFCLISVAHAIWKFTQDLIPVLTIMTYPLIYTGYFPLEIISKCYVVGNMNGSIPAFPASVENLCVQCLTHIGWIISEDFSR